MLSYYDNALPSGSSAAAFVLLRLARLTGNGDHERKATAAMRSVRRLVMRHPLAFGHWLCALDFYLSSSKQIAVVGQPWNPATKSLMTVINRLYLPNKVLAGYDPAQPAQAIHVPLLRDKGMIGDQPTVYVCEGHVCKEPVTEPAALGAMLPRPERQ